MEKMRIWGEFVTALVFFAVGALLALREDRFPWGGLVGVFLYFGFVTTVRMRRSRTATTSAR